MQHQYHSFEQPAQANGLFAMTTEDRGGNEISPVLTGNSACIVNGQESSAREILSYHADEYANDDYTKNPLRYDLEPYNFLRIEGHIGQPYKTALRTILGIRNQYRLPFDVIALSADINSLKTSLESLGKMDTVSKLIEQYAEQLQCDCEFQDLEALYDTLSAELTCTLCKEAKYYYGIVATLSSSAFTSFRNRLNSVCNCFF